MSYSASRAWRADYEHEEYHNVLEAPACPNSDYPPMLLIDLSLDYVMKNERNSGMRTESTQQSYYWHWEDCSNYYCWYLE